MKKISRWSTFSLKIIAYIIRVFALYITSLLSIFLLTT